MQNLIIVVFLFATSNLSADTISPHRCYFLLKKGEVEQVLDSLSSAKDAIPQDVVLQITDTLLKSGLTSNNQQIQLAALYGASIAGSSDLIRYAGIGLKSNYPEVQLAAVSLLGSSDIHQNEYLLRDALRSDTFSVRIEILWLMAYLHSKGAYEQLEALYAKVPSQIQAYLLPLFGIEGSRRSQDFLSHVCRSSESTLQAAALFALSGLSTRERFPLSTPTFLDPLTLESFLIYAASHRDCVPVETIQQYCQHSNEFVRLAAINALAQHDLPELQKLEALAKDKNLFAITLLANAPLTDNSPLFNLIHDMDPTIRTNAGLALLKHARAEALPALIEIIQASSEESFYLASSSPGATMHFWSKIPESVFSGMERTLGQEQSLRFREGILIDSLKLPSSMFLLLADAVVTHAKDLQPLLYQLLENKNDSTTRVWLKGIFNKTSSQFTKLYTAKSLVSLGEEGPWKETLMDWLDSEDGLPLFRPRPLLPWFTQIQPLPNQLTLDERARLALESLAIFVQSSDPQSQKRIMLWMKKTDAPTRILLSGLLTRSCY